MWIRWRRGTRVPMHILRYRNRLSGPLRDRIDLVIEVPAVPLNVLTTAPDGESSIAVRQRVVETRRRQIARFPTSAMRTNANLEGRALRRSCRLDPKGALFPEAVIRRLAFSARGCDRVLKWRTQSRTWRLRTRRDGRSGGSPPMPGRGVTVWRCRRRDLVAPRLRCPGRAVPLLGWPLSGRQGLIGMCA